MTEKKLENVQETHAEMLATAHDLGIEVPEELRADFTDAGAGAAICASLDALIQESRGDKKVLASEDEGGHTATAPKSSSKPKKAASTKKSAKPKKEDTATDPVDVDPPNKEKKMAKTAKKATAKKAAKANARKPAGTAKTSSKRAVFDVKAKIVKTGKENPAKSGSGKFERIQGVLAANGKTVGNYLEKGRRGTLAWCVKNGLVKVA